MAREPSSSTCSPNVMVPRQMRETCRPVFPRRTCSIPAPYAGVTGHGRGHARPTGEPQYRRAVPSVPRVVVVGGGFGGLQCAKALEDAPVEVLLIDQRDYHLFTPLLYQVASCLLNPSEIAAPLRKVFRNVGNVRYRQADVVQIDLNAKQVR